MTDTLRFINPSGLYDPRPNGYSHVAQVPAGWRFVLPAGQGGETVDGTLSADFHTQFVQALDNMTTALAAADATLADVAKITVYVVGHDHAKLAIVTKEVVRRWADALPAMTLVPVPALALEGMQVEIDVIAAVSPDRRRKAVTINP